MFLGGDNERSVVGVKCSDCSGGVLRVNLLGLWDKALSGVGDCSIDIRVTDGRDILIYSEWCSICGRVGTGCCDDDDGNAECEVSTVLAKCCAGVWSIGMIPSFSSRWLGDDS